MEDGAYEGMTFGNILERLGREEMQAQQQAIMAQDGTSYPFQMLLFLMQLGCSLSSLSLLEVSGDMN